MAAFMEASKSYVAKIGDLATQGVIETIKGNEFCQFVCRCLGASFAGLTRISAAGIGQ